MRAILTYAVALALLLPSVATAGIIGTKVEVPPAHVGKVLTRNGYKPENYPPSRFRLDVCFFYCDSLILAELSDTGMTEQFVLFMPRDQLNMEFDIRFTMSIRNDENSIDTLFSRIPPDTSRETMENYEAHGIIKSLGVYLTYGQPVLREVVRTVVAKYDIDEVASSREAINQEIYDAVSEALKGTPVAVKRLAFADVQYPDVIVNAKIKAAEKEAAIQEAEAQQQVTLVNKRTELESAKADRAVRRERALAAKEENEIFASSVTEAYLQYKHLEVLSKLADNPNAVFVPYQALDSLGLSNRIFNPSKVLD